MEVKFKVTDEDGGYHCTFSKLEDAKEQAQEMANEIQKDMFIEKITIEMVGCITPD